MLLRKRDEFAERLPLIRLARRLSDLEEPNDLAFMRFGKSLQRIFLNVQREALSLLFTAADAGQGDVLLHHRLRGKELRPADLLPS